MVNTVKCSLLLASLYAAATVTFVSGAHVCDRNCLSGETPMTCNFNLTLESFVSLSMDCMNCPYNLPDCYLVNCLPLDGVVRSIRVFNKQMPGPAIAVCKNDHIVADVHNLVGGEATSIHWHGMNQVGTPYMDGVAFVTQCPIHPFNAFRYSFPALDVGTHFYHSHMGFQRTNGASGMLVVRQPKADDPNGAVYDHDLTEHHILISDWMNKTGGDMQVAYDYSAEYPSYAPYLDVILVNGRGRLRAFFNASTGATHYTPYSCFTVKQGFLYRFRVCSTASWMCPVEMWVDRHRLRVIGVDGDSVAPIYVESIVINPGERFDIVLDAKEAIGTYWMHFRGLLQCELGGARGRAVLKYENAIDAEPPEVEEETWTSARWVLNPVNVDFSDQKQISLNHLQSLSPWDKTLQEKPDKMFYLPFDFYPTGPDFMCLPKPNVNGTAFLTPPSPLLTQFDDIPKNILCTDEDLARIRVETKSCQCTYYLKVNLGDVVELIMIDEAPPGLNINHPWHLHGHHFRVVNAGETLTRINATMTEVMALDAAGKIKRNLDRPVLKDTVSVPQFGFAVIRFHATNPGFWAFHCHVELHMEGGMMLMFQVGEVNSFAKPPANFPKCSNYLPPIPVQPISTSASVSVKAGEVTYLKPAD